MRALLAAIMVFCAAVAPAKAQQLLLDEEIETMLRDYSDPLLRAADIRPEDVHFYLVGDRSVNAFVTGGQNVFMHTGTILEAEHPGQLKGVLAHEIGHISGGHLVRSGRAETAAIGSMIAAMGVGLAAALAGAPDAGAAIMSGSQQIGMGTFARHTIVQESAADQAAVTFLDATGQSGEGLVEFFDMLRVQEVMRDRSTTYGDFLRTHPLSSARISALRQRVSSSPHYETPIPASEQKALEMIQAKLIGFTDPPNRVLRIYPDSDQSDPARYARSVAHFRNGVLDRALEEIDALIAKEPENPYFHELKGQMLFESGRKDRAIAPYREAVRLMPDSALLRTGLGQAMVAVGDPALNDEAIEHLRTAAHLRPDLAMNWYQLSLVYERTGQRDLAQLAVAEQSYAQGDYIRARAFARRAQDGLERGTLDWRRATDILAVSESLAEEQAERQRRRNLSFQ